LPNGDVEADGVNENVGFDDSFTVGGRLGYWLGLFPYVGVALDISYYTSELNFDTAGELFGNADLRRIPLSGLAMLRLPFLPSPVVPRGHLEPYVAAGPTLFLSHLDLDNDDLRKDVGLDVRAGLNVRITRALGVFAEYRLTYVEQEFKFTRQGIQAVVEADPSTHHVEGGLSLRF
jgi:opacity protein-like surface antigen